MVLREGVKDSRRWRKPRNSRMQMPDGLNVGGGLDCACEIDGSKAWPVWVYRGSGFEGSHIAADGVVRPDLSARAQDSTTALADGVRSSNIFCGASRWVCVFLV